MSENIRKPPRLKKPFDPITPTHLDPEDEKILREIRVATLSEQRTSELRAITTDASMRALPHYPHPHTFYFISSSENPCIFGELQNATCEHICACRPKYFWNFPREIILPPSLHERLEFNMLAPQTFNGVYLFIIAPMINHRPIPVYLDKHRGITLPHDTIMCLLS
jgi:hypothetical protein